MTKINVKPKIFYITTIVIFIGIILLFTAIYPETFDEVRLSHDTWIDVFKQISTTLTTDAPRFMAIIYILLLRFCNVYKILFTILNPFIQLFIIFGMFFVITGRKINFNTKTDFYPFFLLCIMYLLVIPCPSNTLFWFSGTLVYSWGFIFPLILLCLFRKTIDEKHSKDSASNNFLMMLCGFASGMSNENTGPMMLGLTILFLIYCKFKKIKISKSYYFALAGIILGLTAMFGSGAGIVRIKKSLFFAEWLKLPLTEKIILFIGQNSKILNATFWLPIINLIALLLILYDNKKTIFKNKDFILSSLFCICAFILALALLITPDVFIRAYYSSVIFLLISFTITLLLIKKLYQINLTKYFSLLFLIIGIIAGPFIAIPHISIYKQDKYRRSFVKENRKNEKDVFFVPRLIVFSAPTRNWTIEYYDILWPHLKKPLTREFSGNISFTVSFVQHINTLPIDHFNKK